MRIAVLDLGTNTFHLLIADINKYKTTILFKSKVAVKLGEGAIHLNHIAPIPFRRGISALKKYADIIRKFSAKKKKKVKAYGTSAIRSAENGTDFIREARKEAGIKITVIDGSKEAELICLGVRKCISLRKKYLIIDIGGGSTEFIITDHRKIYWKKSFDIGAARLLETFKPSDPVKPSQIRQIENYLGEMLIPLNEAIQKHPIEILVGSSGSFDTFAEMAGYYFRNKNDIRLVNSYQFNMHEYKSLHRLLIRSTYAERLQMKGLIRMRVDMIVIASICTNYVVRKFSIKEMYLSKYALKEGMLGEIDSLIG